MLDRPAGTPTHEPGQYWNWYLSATELPGSFSGVMMPVVAPPVPTVVCSFSRLVRSTCTSAWLPPPLVACLAPT